MATQQRAITVTEFERICIGDQFSDVTITHADVQDLRDYIDNQNSSSGEQGAQLLRPIRNGVQATNYVGVVQTESGLSIEILPKIYGQRNQASSALKVRQIFLKMLKASRNISSKRAQIASLGTNKSSLFEVFIAMFLHENAAVIKSGLMADYIEVADNRKYKKGKLLMKEHLRMNAINQANFYTQADEFIHDITINQIIKATLLFLLKQSHDGANLKLIRQQLVYFEQVQTLSNLHGIFAKLNLPRSYKYYEVTLDWCRIFLAQQSFSSFSGASVSIAILFPMDTIYQSYIAQLISRQATANQVGLQESRYWLFDKTALSQRAYSLIPDIVVRKDEVATILDTKWKILTYKGPSQADLYQMYAYYTRYQQRGEQIDKVILIYPYSDMYTESEFNSLVATELGSEVAAKIQVRFVDLLRDDVEEQVGMLV